MKFKIKLIDNFRLCLLMLLLLFYQNVFSNPKQSAKDDSLIVMAIGKLMDYFENSIQKRQSKSIDYKETFSILPVLCKYYGISFKHEEQMLDTLFQISDKRFCLNHFCFMDRIPNVKVIKKNWKKNTDNIDSRTEYAMFCRQLNIKNKDLEILMKYRNVDLYSLTHVAIQLYLIEMNECFSAEENEKYKSLVLSELLEKHRVKSWEGQKAYDNFSLDIELEIILSILLLSEDLFNLDWNSILNKQLPDGGFPLENGGIKSSLHSSLVAFWLFNHYLAISKQQNEAYH